MKRKFQELLLSYIFPSIVEARRKEFNTNYWYYWDTIGYRDNFVCQKCGYSPIKHKLIESKRMNLKAPTIHIDHIVPLSRGGINSLDNLQCLCSKCNTHKSFRIGNKWPFTQNHINEMRLMGYDIIRKKPVKTPLKGVKPNA